MISLNIVEEIDRSLFGTITDHANEFYIKNASQTLEDTGKRISGDSKKIDNKVE